MSCRRLVCDLLKTFVGWLTEECRHWNCQLAVNWADFTPLLTSRSKPDVVWIERWICNSFGPPKWLCFVLSTLQELRHIPGAHKGVCSSSFSCFFCCRVTFWPTWLNLCRWYWKWQCIQSLISQQGPPHSRVGLTPLLAYSCTNFDLQDWHWKYTTQLNYTPTSACALTLFTVSVVPGGSFTMRYKVVF